MAEHPHSPADPIESRLEFETLISDLSSRFINLPARQVDGEIQDALRRVSDFLGVDLAVLWQWSVAAPVIVAPTHIHHAQEALQPPGPIREEQYPWIRQEMLAGRTVVVSSLEELPVAAAVDRESGSLLGVKSSLCLPLSVGGEATIGALAFNTLRAERRWPAALVKRLQLVAQVFGNALARRRADEALRESEESLNLAAESAEVGFWTLDYDTGVFWATEKARAIFGYSKDEVVTLERFEASVHPDDRDRVREAIDRSAQAGEAVNVEYRISLPGDGGVRWVASRGRPQLGPTRMPERLMGLSIDVTERKRAEDDLRELSRRLIHAHEEERELLARELHDDVTQRLAVLAIEAGRAELAAPDGPQAPALQSIRQGLVRLSEDIHSLAYQLHPSVLEELGLAEALRTECERLGRQGRLEISLELDPPAAVVGRDGALCLFRVAQEALNNVIRHAGARSASVTLRQMDGGLLLAVRDDGVGFDPSSPGRRRSLGLSSMRERVRLVNGTLDIESEPGHGTAVVAWVPAGGETR